MRIRLQKAIDKLNGRLVDLAALVEKRFHLAVKAVECRDVKLANQVIDGDVEIDQQEVDIEEECLKILALHQPVADQLRYIVAVLKMNNDLERIGDLAVNIAQTVEEVAKHHDIQIPFDYFSMAQQAQEMLDKSLEALVSKDLNLAFQVCAQDDDVDTMKEAMQDLFAKEICKKPDQTDVLIKLFLVSRHLERIADHTTNIAEDVIYMISGVIHRHRKNEFQ